MAPTLWRGCDGKLLVGADGKPLYCEADPCAGGPPDDPVTVGCLTAPGSYWTGEAPGSLTLFFDGPIDPGKRVKYSCHCPLYYGTWVLPYYGAGDVACLFPGVDHQAVWRDSYVGLSDSPCPDVGPSPFFAPLPDEIEIYVEAGLDSYFASGSSYCRLRVRFATRFMRHGSPLVVAAPWSHLQNLLHVEKSSLTPLDFGAGFDLVSPSHGIVGTADCPTTSWVGPATRSACGAYVSGDFDWRPTIARVEPA